MNGKRIIFGVTGSIAACKTVFLVRALIKEGAEVQVVMTPFAKEFITPLTLATLSRKPVISEFFSNRDGMWNSHVDLGLWADAMLIAPATASTIGKMANGIADNMLITTYLSCKAPVFIAPAMDLDMFAHQATQQNLDKLRSFGNTIIEPETGELASGLEGKGRMSEPTDIVNILRQFFSINGILCGKKVLITAGPTYEKIDPVRFIGNYSSGKMGFALAEAFAKRGADVTMITGPVSLKTQNTRIKRIDVESADEMYEAAVKHFPKSNYAVLCAAVADYKPENKIAEKIKRENNVAMTIRLVNNRDIAAKLGEMKQPDQILAGFALETKDDIANAKEKLKRKNLDLIVLNSLAEKGTGFGVDTNKVMLIDKHGNKVAVPLKSKTEISDDIVDYLINMKIIWV
ncbi:MAG: bifunctional phosphopantothenoylcysteine decarboxylase/phosphopantothenate--cysteine ligase CoaBC [Prevotellaceae bacterium]|jgi:phosphopantothenoylcysteine decarboxylase/phosphopantothenate--cysteine ligase|nr:bifunctional phosphopantothenoylcysteine decarboxylase/phosphopantothenate--cysteine ligase CoaBC [Prevotellaceae bacterium]